jgi:hypothetical protein
MYTLHSSGSLHSQGLDIPSLRWQLPGRLLPPTARPGIRRLEALGGNVELGPSLACVVVRDVQGGLLQQKLSLFCLPNSLFNCLQLLFLTLLLDIRRRVRCSVFDHAAEQPMFDLPSKP